MNCGQVGQVLRPSGQIGRFCSYLLAHQPVEKRDVLDRYLAHEQQTDQLALPLGQGDAKEIGDPQKPIQVTHVLGNGAPPSTRPPRHTRRAQSKEARSSWPRPRKNRYRSSTKIRPPRHLDAGVAQPSHRTGRTGCESGRPQPLLGSLVAAMTSALPLIARAGCAAGAGGRGSAVYQGTCVTWMGFCGSPISFASP